MDETKLDITEAGTQAPVDVDVTRLQLSCTMIRHYSPEHMRSPDGMGLVVLDYWLNGEAHTEKQAYIDQDFPGKKRDDVVATLRTMVLHNMTRRISKMLADGELE